MKIVAIEEIFGYLKTVKAFLFLTNLKILIPKLPEKFKFIFKSTVEIFQ